MIRILIVEDETSTLNVLGTLLKAEGYDVTPIDRSDRAAKLLETEYFDLMLSDIRMQPLDGMELLKIARVKQPNMSVIMLTGYGRVETAVESLRLGAFDYVTKPFKIDDLFITVQKALKAGAAHIASAVEPAEVHYCFENMVAVSEEMRNVCNMIERIAQTSLMVLICGEDGVGKSLVARTLHAISRRREAPFVHVNCAEMTDRILFRSLFGAAPEDDVAEDGAFIEAAGGTLYVDAIHEMSSDIQDNLLYVLQEKKMPYQDGKKQMVLNTRLVTSTNSNLESLVKAGKMRRELYYRLSALPIEIKPLRERPDDILPLVMHFLRLFVENKSRLPNITPEAIAILGQYRWPGNVRELESVIKHVSSFNRGILGKEDMPPALIDDLRRRGRRIITHQDNEADIYRGRSLKKFLRQKEINTIVEALERAHGDRKLAAENLKISVAALEKQIEAYNLSV